MGRCKFRFRPIATHAAFVWDVLVRGDEVADADARFGAPTALRGQRDADAHWHRVATVVVGVRDNGDVIQEIALNGRLTHAEEQELRDAVEREVDGALRDRGARTPA